MADFMDKAKNKAQEFGGKAKEKAGDAMDDREMQNEGKADQAKGEAKNKAAEAGDKLKEKGDQALGGLRPDDENR